MTSFCLWHLQKIVITKNPKFLSATFDFFKTCKLSMSGHKLYIPKLSGQNFEHHVCCKVHLNLSIQFRSLELTKLMPSLLYIVVNITDKVGIKAIKFY